MLKKRKRDLTFGSQLDFLGSAEGWPPESHVFRTRHQTPLAESQGNEQLEQLQTLTGIHLPLSPEEAGDADRAAQKEKLHAELKRVLQRKSESQRSVEEAKVEEEPLASSKMEAKLSKMEKTIKTAELVEIIVETEAEAGVSGMSVAGGGREGIFIKDVLKDSPAARALSLREGDQLLSARVYFDNIKYEDALQILKCAEPYKVSFWLKRTVPSVDVTHKPGATTFEVRGPKAKMAKLNIQSLKPLKKKKKKMKVTKGLQQAKVPELVPIDVEFSMPTFSNLRRARHTGDVAVAEPSPDISPHLSLLETKRRKMKFPRLKVKEAAAALAARTEGAEGRLEVGLPKVAAVETKVAGKGEGEGKVSRFTIPFSKAKKPKEEAGAKAEVGFQAPQVELDLPLLKVGPSGEPPKSSTKGEGFQIQAPSFGLPKVEAVLPKVSTVGLEGSEGGLQTGRRLPTAEVAAPKVDVDLSLPKLGGAIPEVALKGEGVKIKDLKEAEMKMPTIKASVLKVALGEGKAKGLEEKPKLAMTMPTLEMDVPSADVEIPVLQRKAEAELPKQKVAIPDVSLKVPMVSLPKLGAKPHEELEGKLPQVELSVGKAESPKAKAKDPKIQIPGLGISLLKCKSESKEDVTVAADSKAKVPGVRVPALDISVTRVTNVQLPSATVELAAPTLGVKAEEAAEGPGFKLQMPQVSLPKFDIPAKTAPSPPRIHTKVPKPEVDLGVKVDVPKLDLSLPSAKLPDVELPKARLPKPELDICVEKPNVEVAVPSARLSFPSAAMPALNIDLPKVGVELGLPKVEGEFGVSDQPPVDHEIKLKMPTVETISKDLEVEISVPTCRADLSELELSERVMEGADVSGMVAKIPKVDLACGKEPPAAKGERGAGGVSLGLNGKQLPKLGLELESSLAGAKTKLPSVEIAAVKLPDVTVESGKSLKPEAKLKSPKFSLSKFSISGPKAWKMSTEASAPEVEGPELASKLKMPKFGISFPKSKWGAEVEGPKLVLGLEGKHPKEGAPVDVDSSESGVKVPSVALPAVDFEVPKVAVDIGLPKGKAELLDEEGSGTSPEVGIDLPDIKLKVPKVSLPKFGGQEKESDLELKAGEAKLRGSREGLAAGLEKEPKAKVPKFKMPSFSMTRRDTAEGSGPEVDAKLKKARGSPTEKPKGLLVRMPKLKLSSPKGEAERGKLHVQVPELQVKVPQVELPKFGTKEAEAEARLAVGSESPSLRVKVPSLEIAMPGTQAEGELILEKPVVDVSVADIRSHEGELKIPKVPLLDVSAPKVELDLSLPTADAEVSMPHGAIDADAKIKLPKVELPKFGRSEEGGMEAEVQLSEGHRLSLGRAGGEEAEGAAEGATFASKIRVPKVDFSFPKARLSDVELPLTEGERSAEGPEGKFKMPSVGLPRFSTPKVKAPELEFDMSLEGGKMPKVKVSGPVIKLPKFGGSSSDREGEAEMDLSRVPQLELKAPKLRGSNEVLGAETGGKEAKIKMPSVPVGFGLSKEEAEVAVVADESKFKLKIPALSISKASAESSPDTQPLCPSADGADLSFKMPQITLPDVGFSVDQYGKGEAGKLAGEAGVDVDVGGLEAKLKMPKLKMPTFEGSGPKGDTDTSSPSQGCRGSGETDLEGETAAAAAFKMPSLEISAPSLKTHAEYEVEGSQHWHISSQELEGAGKRSRASSDGRKSPGGKEGSSDVDAGKKYRVKIPKFGLSLPKAGLEAREGVPGQEAEAKIKRPIFVLGWPKVKAAEGSSGLLEGDDEAEGKGMMAKLKLRPTFGLSLSKPKTGAEVNGELEEGGSSKLKMPKLGFSKGEGAAQLNGERAGASLQNGAQDNNKNKLGKIRLPQVELSSPSKMAKTDPELNLKLVRAEEAKEEAYGGAAALAALKAAKFKSPKITFSGFKKRNGEAAPSAVVSSAARTEMASLETGDAAAKGEKSPKFRFPKLALSSKSHGVLEITSERQDGLGEEEEEGLKVKLPQVGFSGELSSEEQKGKATAAV